MANKNYTKFSEHLKKDNNTVINGQISIDESGKLSEEEIANLKDEDVITVNSDGNCIGIVTGCNKLNVRKESKKDSEPLCVINENEEVEVDLSESTVYFYKVKTSSGVEGYCMKEYINVN